MERFRSMQATYGYEGGKAVFYSCRSKVLAIDGDTIELCRDYDYSRTTGKQIRYYFYDIWGIDLGVPELRKALKNGTEVYGRKVVMGDF